MSPLKSANCLSTSRKASVLFVAYTRSHPSAPYLSASCSYGGAQLYAIIIFSVYLILIATAFLADDLMQLRCLKNF